MSTYAEAGELVGRSERTLTRWLRDPALRAISAGETPTRGELGPVETLRGALQATKASGQPDWPTRVAAVKALAALRPDEVEQVEPENEQRPSIVVYDLPPGAGPVVHHARSGGETAVSAADTPPANSLRIPIPTSFSTCSPAGSTTASAAGLRLASTSQRTASSRGALCTPTTPPRPNTGGRSSPPAGSQSTSRTRAERRALSAPSTASGKSTVSDQFATAAGMLRSGWLRTDVLPRVYREESRSVAVCWNRDRRPGPVFAASQRLRQPGDCRLRVVVVSGPPLPRFGG
jgi:hypothetical protein